MVATLNTLAQSKADQEKMALQIAEGTSKDGLYRLMMAIAKSERILAEDVMREAGFMLPQSNNAHTMLKELVDTPPTPAFPAEAAKKLLEKLPDNG